LVGLDNNNYTELLYGDEEMPQMEEIADYTEKFVDKGSLLPLLEIDLTVRLRRGGKVPAKKAMDFIGEVGKNLVKRIFSRMER